MTRSRMAPKRFNPGEWAFDHIPTFNPLWAILERRNGTILARGEYDQTLQN